MKGNELTSQNDFGFHLKDDWRAVHGLWPQIKDYLDRHIPRLNWKTTPVALSITGGGVWYDLDLTSNTSATCFAVILAVRFYPSGSPGRWAIFYTRKNGSSADYEGIASFYYNTPTEDVRMQNAGCQIIQAVDSGQVLNYKADYEGALTVHLVGYWDYAA